MNDALLIRLDALRGPCWQVFDRAGNGIGLPRRGPLSEAAAHASGRSATVLVPGEHVLTLQLKVPTRQRDRLARAIAGVLEDRLADDIDVLHFVPGPAARDGSVSAAVVAQSLMQGWLTELGTVGLGAARMLPDYLALPWPADGWRALSHDGRLLVRTGPGTGWSADAALAPQVFAAALDERPTGVVLHAAEEDALAGQLVSIARGRDVAVDRVACSTLEAEALLARGQGDAALDLRHGMFRVQRDLWRGAQRWRLPLMLSAALVALLAIQAGVSVWQLNRESSALAASIRATYLPVLPGIEEPAIARLELENRVARLGGSGRTSALLEDLGRIGAAARATGAQLAGLDLEGSRWTLEVEADETAALQALRDRLATDLGRTVELAGATRTADGAQGRLVLETSP